MTVEESLIHRINPSLNEVAKATIECSLYIPPGKRETCSSRYIFPFVHSFHLQIMILERENCGLDWYGIAYLLP